MVVEHTRALVSYDDRKKGSPQNRDYEVAWQCANFLKQKGVNAEVKGYSESALDAADTHWLILIHSSDARPPSSLVNDVNTALDSVVARRMRDVMVISTDASDLRPEWASIRKYDISRPGEENATLGDMLSAMKYVKLPYNQALNQQKQHALQSRGEKAPSVRQLIVLVSAIVIVMLGVVSSIIYLPGYLHPVSTASATATAIARATVTRSTGTVTTTQPVPGVSAATQNAKQKELRTLTKGAPSIQGFRIVDQWDTPIPTSVSSCALANNTYTVNMSNPNQYMPCLAAKTAFMNVVMQVTMKIQGDAGGIIFRYSNVSKSYYRLSVNQSNATTPKTDTFSLFRCSGDCTTNNVDIGTSLATNVNVQVDDHTKPIMLTLIAQTTTFDVFINGQFVASIADTSFTTPWSGQIGAYAASLGNDTTVTFSNLKVWSLDHPTTQPTGKSTSTPTTP
jgi:hypothetical protein